MYERRSNPYDRPGPKEHVHSKTSRVEGTRIYVYGESKFREKGDVLKTPF